jgi:hypothetical protein
LMIIVCTKFMIVSASNTDKLQRVFAFKNTTRFAKQIE